MARTHFRSELHTHMFYIQYFQNVEYLLTYLLVHYRLNTVYVVKPKLLNILKHLIALVSETYTVTRLITCAIMLAGT